MADKHNRLEEVPKWDVAISSLVSDEYKNSGQALDKDTLDNLASKHTIRFDDIMVTMCSLVENGVWTYLKKDGDELSSLVDLFEDGRLSKENALRFQGTWLPKD